jgi:hypothetical protein
LTFAERTFLNPEWWFSVVVRGLVVGLVVLYASRWLDTAVARVRHRRATSTARKRDLRDRYIAGVRANPSRLLWISAQAQSRRLRVVHAWIFASLLGLLALALSLGVVPLPDAFGQRLFTWALVLVMSLVLVGSAKEADQATLLEDVLANG